MDQAAQDFWLAELARSGKFNAWAFSRFRHALAGHVMEVGCGTGNFTQLMAGLGLPITALDIHEPYVETARQRLSHYENVTVRCEDVLASGRDEQFDTIVMLDVLEHIEDDVGTLGGLKRRLRPGGNIILKVPAHRWLHNGMDDAVGHHRRYDRRTLSERAGRAGLRVSELSYFNAAAVAGWLLNGRILGRKTPPGEQVAAFNRAVPVLRWVEDKIPMPFGLSIIAVCTRQPH